MTLDDYLKKATDEGWAIAHFNVGDFAQFRAVVDAARVCRAPIMIGTSDGEAEFFGMRVIRAMTTAVQEETGVPVFLNADHFHTVEKCIEAIDAGYDGILIDLSKQPYADNVHGVRAVMEYVKRAKRRVSVEGELGYIVTDSSKVYKGKVAVPKESLTNPEEAERYIHETGIHRFAAAVGTIHGISSDAPDEVDFSRIQELRHVIPRNVGFVLHGGSGVSDDDFREAVRLGVTNIHISTTLRVAYAKTLAETMAKKSDDIAPYKFLGPSVKAMQDVAEHYIRLFGGEGKAMMS